MDTKQPDWVGKKIHVSIVNGKWITSQEGAPSKKQETQKSKRIIKTSKPIIPLKKRKTCNLCKLVQCHLFL